MDNRYYYLTKGVLETVVWDKSGNFSFGLVEFALVTKSSVGKRWIKKFEII